MLITSSWPSSQWKIHFLSCTARDPQVIDKRHVTNSSLAQTCYVQSNLFVSDVLHFQTAAVIQQSTPEYPSSEQPFLFFVSVVTRAPYDKLQGISLLLKALSEFFRCLDHWSYYQSNPRSSWSSLDRNAWLIISPGSPTDKVVGGLNLKCLIHRNCKVIMAMVDVRKPQKTHRNLKPEAMNPENQLKNQ